jgi:hypothetical protein
MACSDQKNVYIRRMLKTLDRYALLKDKDSGFLTFALFRFMYVYLYRVYQYAVLILRNTSIYAPLPCMYAVP